jgi:hypothetical protein
LLKIRRNTRFAVARIDQTAAAANELVVVFPVHRTVMNFHIRTSVTQSEYRFPARDA